MADYVLPRVLTPSQIDGIAQALRDSKIEQDVEMVIASNDNEAGNYAAHIRQALEKARWVVVKYSYVNDLVQGLSINGSQPAGPPPTARQRLDAVPDPKDVLVSALRANGAGPQQVGGIGVATTTYVLIVKVGPRPNI